MESEKLLAKNFDTSVKVSTTPYTQQSQRMQMAMCAMFVISCLMFLYVLETKLTEQQRELEFAYKEFYSRPFHYKLDPFSYVELKNGAPITEPEPPNPHFMFSFEELLLNRFLDYYFWAKGDTDETDATTDPERMPLTIQAFGAHLRNRLYYQLERDQLKINPILLTEPEVPEKDDLKPEDTLEPSKLMWNVVPYCSDPVLEDSLHELGNIHGFLWARGNHKNYRFVNEPESGNISAIVGAVPIKLAYLHSHNYINFNRKDLKEPVHISIICEPVARKYRHFYTERYLYREWSEDFPISKSSWWRTTLEECMANNKSRECSYEGVRNIKRRSNLDIGRTWLPRRVEWAIPQFCEFDRCDHLGDPKDLEYVKEISQKAYTVVGTLENINATLDLLEAKVPQFFKGIKKMYQKKLKRVAKNVPGPEIPVISSEMRAEMEKRYAPEMEFYRFVSDRLTEQVDQLSKQTS